MSTTPVKDNPFDFKITYEPDFILNKYRISDEAADQIDELYPEIFKGKKITIKRLHRLCKKYPRIPQFKNYLSIAYESSNNHRKAAEINRELLQQHPGYLFGIFHKAELLISDDELSEVPEYLGEEMHIHKLYPDRDTFHIGEVLKYYSIAIRYLLKRDRVDDAKLRLDYLSEIDPEAPETRLALLAFMQFNVKNHMQRLDNEKLKERIVKSRSYLKDLQTDQAPSFTHSEIEELYKHGLDIPEMIIRTILQLPRETLITDLERVLQDAINRYEYFKDEVDHEGWNDNYYNFTVHAIFLLTELHSKQSLDSIMDLLRQGDEFREFWYSDLLEDVFSEPVAILAEENLEAITNFVKEPDLDAYCRNIGLSALENVVRFHDERRNEVIKHFDDLIRFHLGEIDNERIIDTTLISFLVWSCVNISAEELLPSIRKLFEHNLIHETMVGDLKGIEHDIKGEMVYRNAQPKTILERYEYLTTGPFTSGFAPPDGLPDNKGTLDLFSNFLEDEPYDSPELHSFDPELDPAMNPYHDNPYKDAGRNDPCPCGSGKKYKKCCL